MRGMQTCVPRGEHTRARGQRLWGGMEDSGGGKGRALREVLGVGVTAAPGPSGVGPRTEVAQTPGTSQE